MIQGRKANTIIMDEYGKSPAVTLYHGEWAKSKSHLNLEGRFANHLFQMRNRHVKTKHYHYVGRMFLEDLEKDLRYVVLYNLTDRHPEPLDYLSKIQGEISRFLDNNPDAKVFKIRR